MGKHARPRTDPQAAAAQQRATEELHATWSSPLTGRPGAPPSPPARDTPRTRRRWAIACRASAHVLDREGRPQDAERLRELADTAEIPLPEPAHGHDAANPIPPRPTEAISQTGGRP